MSFKNEIVRPREIPDVQIDEEPRKKCTVCCALRHAAIVGIGCGCVFLPFRLVMLGRKLFGDPSTSIAQRSWHFVNESMMWPLGLGVVTFSHQWILSELLWSKSKKSVWSVNVQSILGNMALCLCMIACATLYSRNVLIKKSKWYRSVNWEYQRRRRITEFALFPSIFGTMEKNLNLPTCLWMVSLYTAIWAGLSMLMEKQQERHYAILPSTSHSKWCSPRWREWRELQVMKEVPLNKTDRSWRYGIDFDNNKWNALGIGK